MYNKYTLSFKSAQVMDKFNSQTYKNKKEIIHLNMVHIHPLPTLFPSLHSHFPSSLGGGSAAQLVVLRDEENGGFQCFTEKKKNTRLRGLKCQTKKTEKKFYKNKIKTP